jgi:hypothetical protein
LACGNSALEEFYRKVQLSCVVSAKVGVEPGDALSKLKLTGVVNPFSTRHKMRVWGKANVNHEKNNVIHASPP